MGYMGAKGGAGVFQNIVALMPPHDFYCEAFAGSGAVAERKPPAARTLLLDKDPAAVAALKAGQLAALPGVEIREADAFAYLADLAADLDQLGRVLVYVDPPYLLSTRTSDKRYRCEISEADHVRLAEILADLAALGVAVIVSGYPSPLYDQLYAGWETREFQAMTRGGVRTEKLWLSYTPGAVHWATYAGRNFTDRQRIKRKAARWAERFAKLPPAERQAVLAALMAARDPAQSEPSMAESAGPIDAPDYVAGGKDLIDGGDYGRRRGRARPTQSGPSMSTSAGGVDPIAVSDYATVEARPAEGVNVAAVGRR